MILNDRTYDILKWLAQLVLPALATLYSVFGAVWGAQAVEEVVGTCLATSVFLGAILGLSNANYNQQKVNLGDIPLNDRPNDSGLEFPEENSTPFNFDQKTYETLKWFTMSVFPAVGTLYLGLSTMWGFPYGQAVATTIAALTTFVSVILGISKAQFNNKG